MNKTKFRKYFPQLKTKNFIYFDNASTLLKSTHVIKSVDYYNKKLSSNIGRGIYKTAYNTTVMYENARDRVAKFLNVDSNEIVFTSNTTDSLNLVANSFGINKLSRGDEIITTITEHHSSILPWFNLAKKVGAKIIYVPLNKNHKVTVANFKKVVSNKTKFVVMTYVSNVVGYINPIREISAIAHSVGAYMVVDGAQAINHFKVDLNRLDVDFFAFSGYKIGATTGVGVLYINNKHIFEMKPIKFGGGMTLDFNGEILEYKEGPQKFEAGTMPIMEVLSLKTAIDFIDFVGYEYIVKKDNDLKDYLLDNLLQISDVEIYNRYADIALISFNLKNIHAHDAASLYDKFGICVRAGHHCSQPLIEYLGQSATLRVSLAYYNTFKEIDLFIKATKEIIQFFKDINVSNKEAK